jgi:hypothetical protein
VLSLISVLFVWVLGAMYCSFFKISNGMFKKYILKTLYKDNPDSELFTFCTSESISFILNDSHPVSF